MRKWDDPWWTKTPTPFERLQDKLDHPVLVFIAFLAIAAYYLWAWAGVAVVTALVLVAAVAFGALFVLLWIIAEIYESGRR